MTCYPHTSPLITPYWPLIELYGWHGPHIKSSKHNTLAKRGSCLILTVEHFLIQGSLPYFPADHQMVSSLCHTHFLEPDLKTDLQLWFSPKLIRFVLEEDAHRDMANGMTHAVSHQSEIKFFSICD